MIGGATKQYYYDGQRVLLDTDGSGVSQRYYVWGNYIDEALLMRKLTGTAADYYYGHDHLYSACVLFNGSGGTIAERYEYDAYGKMYRLNENFTDFSGTEAGNPYYFTGRELDSIDSNALKIMYYRARSYDPTTGRFLQRDPIGIDPAGGKANPFYIRSQYTDGANLFEYVKSRPCIVTDWQGLASGVAGETSCDSNTGKVVVKIFNTGSCVSVCTKEHENKHKDIRSTCCQRLKECIDAGRVSRAKCEETYDEWVKRTRDTSECIAYQQSVSCANWQMFWKGCNANKCKTNVCCKELDDYKKDREASAKDYCSKARKNFLGWPEVEECPFGWWGVIK